jgi:hypothetical protein
MLDSFSTTNIINTGEDKAAVTTVTLKVNGYLIADSVNKHLADTGMHYSAAQIIFGLETVENVNDGFVASSQIANSQSGGTTSFLGSAGDISTFSAPSPLITGQSLQTTSFVGNGVNVTNEYQSYTGLTPEDLAYIATNIAKTSSPGYSINTVTFNGASWLEPSAGSQLPPTSISNFTYAINGVAVSLSEIVSIGSDGMGNLILIFDVNQLGYTLAFSDQITVTGKFA